MPEEGTQEIPIPAVDLEDEVVTPANTPTLNIDSLKARLARAQEITAEEATGINTPVVVPKLNKFAEVTAGSQSSSLNKKKQP